jgi:hypothetical protein
MQDQIEGIRRPVRASIESIERGGYAEYHGRDGLKKLADGVKARGRRLLGGLHCPRPDQRRYASTKAGPLRPT